MTYKAPNAETLRNILDAIPFDSQGLIAAIAQEASPPHRVLMLAWMNRDAVAETLLSGQVCYWSRSRRRLWRKGESSGQVQKLVTARLDCDCDAILLQVIQTGVACHTGRLTCFYQEVTPNGLKSVIAPSTSPDLLYPR